MAAIIEKRRNGDELTDAELKKYLQFTTQLVGMLSETRAALGTASLEWAVHELSYAKRWSESRKNGLL